MNEVVSIVSFASIKRGVGGFSWSIRKLEILELAISNIACINLKEIHVPIKLILGKQMSS